MWFSRVFSLGNPIEYHGSLQLVKVGKLFRCGSVRYPVTERSDLA
jgi:hypothetical protein